MWISADDTGGEVWGGRADIIRYCLVVRKIAPGVSSMAAVRSTQPAALRLAGSIAKSAPLDVTTVIFKIEVIGSIVTIGIARFTEIFPD